ncbi:MAG TPA: uroporphyrinogen-III synthase [Saprospiraceae bacterium]|nr:uroporphyrinogen-III synthase [Saprospiraceae bacterium]HMQ85483.1 uroporphyrinogen-III synthase [Saprospiraceae bacterium]
MDKQQGIFISRELSREGVLYQGLIEQGFVICDQSLIEFTGLPFDVIPKADWVFFYSSRAVQYFFNSYQGDKNDYKWAAMGEGTAKALQELGIQAHFTGDGHPQNVAAAFVQVAENQVVLFPRARQSKQSVQQLLAGRIQDVAMIVYENRAKKDFYLPECKILVFTSPLNVDAYFGKYTLTRHQKIVAIGHTTASSIRRLGYEVTVAAAATEAALLESISKVIKTAFSND